MYGVEDRASHCAYHACKLCRCVTESVTLVIVFAGNRFLFFLQREVIAVDNEQA